MPVGVGELTDHLGLNHNAIRQHLTKLVAADLLLEGRVPTGGPGRPRLAYMPAPTVESRWGATGPYERLAFLLTEVISTGETPVEIGRRAGRREAADHREDAVAAVLQVMAASGFDPTVEGRHDGVDVVLRTCPYASTALVAPDSVCELHRGLAMGVVESVGGAVVEDLIRNDPRTAQCRLLINLDPDVPPGAEQSHRPEDEAPHPGSP